MGAAPDGPVLGDGGPGAPGPGEGTGSSRRARWRRVCGVAALLAIGSLYPAAMLVDRSPLGFAVFTTVVVVLALAFVTVWYLLVDLGAEEVPLPAPAAPLPQQPPAPGHPWGCVAEALAEGLLLLLLLGVAAVAVTTWSWHPLAAVAAVPPVSLVAWRVGVAVASRLDAPPTPPDDGTSASRPPGPGDDHRP